MDIDVIDDGIVAATNTVSVDGRQMVGVTGARERLR